MKEIIYLGSDHAGLKLKNSIKSFLVKNNNSFADVGPLKYNKNDDYPDYALAVCKKVKQKNALGILICSSGQGMSISANKIKGIRAALCCSSKVAKYAREHVNANVLCLAASLTNKQEAEKIIKIWLKSKFTKVKRHIRRINKIKRIEKCR